MQLTDIDGNTVYVRSSEIIAASQGSTQRPNPDYAKPDGPQLATEIEQPKTIMVPCLVLTVRGVPPMGIKDTPENRDAIGSSIAAFDRLDQMIEVKEDHRF